MGPLLGWPNPEDQAYTAQGRPICMQQLQLLW